MTLSETPPHYRRNFSALVTDFGFFGIAMAFVGPTTVVPGLLSTLGASASLIGLVATLQRAGWLLPQLISARYMANKPYKKPYILWAAGASRLLFLFLAGLLWATGARPSNLILAIFVPVFSLFWIGDGFGSLPWFDLLSKTIPPYRRGRLTSVGQVLSGLFGFLAGFAVEWILGDQGPSYPNNYASLFFIAFLMLAVSFVAISLIIERKGVSARVMPTWREYLPQLWRVLNEDRAFRRYTIARQFLNLNALATPFYMTYALEALHLPAQVAGRYTSIGVVGGILAAILFGWVNEQRGTKQAIQISVFITAAIPLVAILIPLLLPDSPWLAWAYGLVFFTYNASMSSYMPAWTAYMLELAPEAERPMYVGLNNTLNGVTTLFSTLGGLILYWTDNNYILLFILTTVGTLATYPLAASLPEPRGEVDTSRGR